MNPLEHLDKITVADGYEDLNFCIENVFSPDGKHLYAIASGRILAFGVDGGSLRHIQTFMDEPGPDGALGNGRGIAASPDGNWISPPTDRMPPEIPRSPVAPVSPSIRADASSSRPTQALPASSPFAPPPIDRPDPSPTTNPMNPPRPITVIACCLASAIAAHAELKLPAIIGDNMVLQQKQANPIWGWDTPGTEVTVTFSGQSKTAKAGDDGRWSVSLDPLDANATPANLSVKGSTSKELGNILIGEVWVCSGQSNMGWPVSASWDYDLEILSANHPQIRLISVPNVGTQELQNDFKGQWDECSPKTVGSFSAVGYFYGRLLHQTLGVPVGLIDNAWGGSAAEAWVRRDLIEEDDRFKNVMDEWRNREAGFDFEKLQAEHQEKMKAWEARRDEAKANNQPVPQQPQGPQNILAGNQRPGNLYAGCLHPVIGYGIRGAIWYQGESNASRADQYNDLMTLLIRNWRADWKQGDFPFYFVQLADFMAEKPHPGDSAWAALREAQTETMNTVENTGQAVIIDIGEANDIHPRNKQDVADRLARWALVKDYGFEGIPHRSPEFKSMEIDGNKALVTLDHIGGGLRSFDVNELKGFAIAGEDGKWVWADARFVSGNENQIEVTSSEVSAPTAVRYAWADNPVANVRTVEGLPLTPFRTDKD